MSHFTVTVCLNNPDDLETALAPFDENKKAEPYRSYETDSPADFWAVDLLREEAGLNPDDATLTWAQVAEAHNTHWPDPVNDAVPMHVDESGRAYTMSTYNEKSKWDWYQIGGRWTGRFPYKQEHENLVIMGERSWMSADDVVMPLHCDGGQKLALSLNVMRDEAGAEAVKTYARYEAAVAGTPEALPWSTFADNVSEGNGCTIERAREEYGSQPRIAALRKNRDFGIWADNEDYACGRKLFIERARARAVPGYAVLTADGRWLTPGDMGWFGMSRATEGSRIGYWEIANAYIEALPDDAWLVSVDCHI